MGDKPAAYRYGATGNRIDANGANISEKYTYNAAGQLASILKSNTIVGDYKHNYLNQLTIHSNQKETKNYFYDESGHLLAESKEDGTIIREYIWLEDKPVIINESLANKFYAVHTDHLDRPLMLTNAAKAEIWKAVWKPWGNVYKEHGESFVTAPNFNSSSRTAFIPTVTVNNTKVTRNK